MRLMKFITEHELESPKTTGIRHNQRHAYSIEELDNMDDGTLINHLSGIYPFIDHQGDFIGLIRVVDRIKEQYKIRQLM